MKGIIFGASAIEDYDFYKNKICEDDFIICADGGIHHAQKLGVAPDVIIGDFDSSNPPKEYENIIYYPPEKDDTDTALCLKYAIDKQLNPVFIFGGLSGRLDHSLSNIHLLKYGLTRNCHVELIDEHTRIFLIEKKTTIQNEGYRYLSAFPLGEQASGINYKGLKFPLINATLKTGIPLGVSNQFISDTAEISVEEGTLLIILIR